MNNVATKGDIVIATETRYDITTGVKIQKGWQYLIIQVATVDPAEFFSDIVLEVPLEIKHFYHVRCIQTGMHSGGWRAEGFTTAVVDAIDSQLVDV